MRRAAAVLVLCLVGPGAAAVQAVDDLFGAKSIFTDPRVNIAGGQFYRKVFIPFGIYIQFQVYAGIVIGTITQYTIAFIISAGKQVVQF